MTPRQIKNRNKVISVFGEISIDYTWDQLMNIVEKIENTKVSDAHKQFCLDNNSISEYYFVLFKNICCYNVEIDKDGSHIMVVWDQSDKYDPMVEPSYLGHLPSKNKKEALYLAIYQFIKTL